jgi:hypothetical protein
VEFDDLCCRHTRDESLRVDAADSLIPDRNALKRENDELDQSSPLSLLPSSSSRHPVVYRVHATRPIIHADGEPLALWPCLQDGVSSSRLAPFLRT